MGRHAHRVASPFAGCRAPAQRHDFGPTRAGEHDQAEDVRESLVTPDFVQEARKSPRQLGEAFKFWGAIDPFDIMDRTGGRLETTEFRAGDIAIFTMYTPHGTLKNQTGRIRVSTDIRYQLTSEPLDMNYMGDNPRHRDIIAGTIGEIADRPDLIGRLG